MKLLTNDNVEATVERVYRTYDTDSESVNIDVADEENFEILRKADLSRFELMRKNRSNVVFEGFADPSFSVDYDDAVDRYSVSLRK